MKNFLRNNRAVAAIEMAIILPVLLVIIMAVIEFGLYFLKSQAASRAVATASIALQNDPSNPGIKPNMQQGGLGFMDLSQSPNFVCAKAYATSQAAEASCVSGEWLTDRPAGLTSTDNYYIAVKAYATHTPLTPLRALSGSFPPDIVSKNTVPILSVDSVQHGIQVLTTGSQWIVPDGFTKIKATIIGGGGGANGGWNSGGGGGGSCIVVFLNNLTPRNIINYSIGAGAASDSSGVAKTGGSTVFNNLTAVGGGGSWNGAAQGPGGKVTTGQTVSSGRISTIAYFDGSDGGEYGGSGMSCYTSYGAGGGPNFNAKQGAVILEW